MQIVLLFFIVILSSLNAVDPVIAAYYDKNSRDYPAIRTNGFVLDQLPSDLLTDLYFAYLSIDIPSKLNPYFQFLANSEDKRRFEELDELKKRSKKLNLFLSVGGKEFNDPKDADGIQTYQLFSKMAADPHLRSRFIEAIITYSYKYGFDGIDIDWQFPGDSTRGGTPRDLDNFISLLKEFHDRFIAIQPRLLLSATFSGTVPIGLPKTFQEKPESYFKWIAECSKYLDRVQALTYDYHSPFTIPKLTGVNAPLNRDADPSSSLFVAKSIDRLIESGIPKEKIILGLPLFGNGYSGVSDLTKESFLPGKPFIGASALSLMSSAPGMIPYYEIVYLINSGLYVQAQEPLTNTMIGYSIEKKEWISFDNPETIKLKAELAKEKGLGGVFFWSVDRDNFKSEPHFPCIKAAKSAFSSSL